jgi:excisionase family DNA binding protein
MAEAFVPIENVAKHFSVSISTVRAWLRNNKIPTDTYIKVGPTYRFKLPEVEAALMGGVQTPKIHLTEISMPEQIELDLDDDA